MARTAKIKSFDHSTVRRLREAVDEALEKVGQQFGVAIQSGNARFSSSKVTFKVEAAVSDEGGERVEAVEFRRLAPLYGLEADDLGRTFIFRGSPYKIVGFKASSRKYPILGESARGTVYKFMVSDVIAGLKA